MKRCRRAMLATSSSLHDPNSDISPLRKSLAFNHGAAHEFMPRRPMLFGTTSMIDVSADAVAEAGIAEILCRPLVSTELAAALAPCLRPPGILRT